LLSLSQKIKSSQVVQTKKIGTNPIEDYLLWRQQMFSNLFHFFLLCYVLLALKVLPSLQAKTHKKTNQFLKFCKLKTFGTWNLMD
jgi:hypothetical protein